MNNEIKSALRKSRWVKGKKLTKREMQQIIEGKIGLSTVIKPLNKGVTRGGEPKTIQDLMSKFIKEQK